MWRCVSVLPVHCLKCEIDLRTSLLKPVSMQNRQRTLEHHFISVPLRSERTSSVEAASNNIWHVTVVAGSILTPGTSCPRRILSSSTGSLRRRHGRCPRAGEQEEREVSRSAFLENAWLESGPDLAARANAPILGAPLAIAVHRVVLSRMTLITHPINASSSNLGRRKHAKLSFIRRRQGYSVSVGSSTTYAATCASPPLHPPIYQSSRRRQACLLPLLYLRCHRNHKRSTNCLLPVYLHTQQRDYLNTSPRRTRNRSM